MIVSDIGNLPLRFWGGGGFARKFAFQSMNVHASLIFSHSLIFIYVAGIGG